MLHEFLYILQNILFIIKKLVTKTNMNERYATPQESVFIYPW